MPPDPIPLSAVENMTAEVVDLGEIVLDLPTVEALCSALRLAEVGLQEVRGDGHVPAHEMDCHACEAAMLADEVLENLRLLVDFTLPEEADHG